MSENEDTGLLEVDPNTKGEVELRDESHTGDLKAHS